MNRNWGLTRPRFRGLSIYKREFILKGKNMEQRSLYELVCEAGVRFLEKQGYETIGDTTLGKSKVVVSLDSDYLVFTVIPNHKEWDEFPDTEYDAKLARRAVPDVFAWLREHKDYMHTCTPRIDVINIAGISGCNAFLRHGIGVLYPELPVQVD